MSLGADQCCATADATISTAIGDALPSKRVCTRFFLSAGKSSSSVNFLRNTGFCWRKSMI
ncbi:Uncharacterised protein [Mycobacteroides abscessus subsp. abscessus]|nr:Uncharacterised protein [Mycobacteroides abscessus subsp. abscessus]